jgi:gluconolactonase
VNFFTTTANNFAIRKSAMKVVSKLIVLAALTFGLALLDSTAVAQPQLSQPLQKIDIIRLDPRFDKLVPLNVRVERIVSRRKWVEGPVWNRREGYLLFSDIPANSVIKWQKGIGASVYLKPSGYTGNPPFGGPEPGSNGLAFDPQGRLVLAAHGDRRIARLERNGKQTTLIDRFEGKRINSPNDLVFNSNGDLYFTDPPFGLPKSYDDPRKELPYQGAYRLTRSGKLSLLTKDIKAPNGIAFSPDEKKLYISNADPANAVWMVYEVKPDGTIENGKVLFNATGWTKDKTGAPDGMKVDRDGNIFGAGPGGVYVIAPDGTHLGTIDLDAPTGNVAFGEDGSSLFITSNQNVYRLKLTTRGASY